MKDRSRINNLGRQLSSTVGAKSTFRISWSATFRAEILVKGDFVHRLISNLNALERKLYPAHLRLMQLRSLKKPFTTEVFQRSSPRESLYQFNGRGNNQCHRSSSKKPRAHNDICDAWTDSVVHSNDELSGMTLQESVITKLRQGNYLRGSWITASSGRNDAHSFRNDPHARHILTEIDNHHHFDRGL